MQSLARAKGDPALIRRAAEHPALAEVWREDLRKRLGWAGTRARRAGLAYGPGPMMIRGSRWARAMVAAIACAVALAGAASPDPPAADPPAAIAALGLDPAQARLWREGLALETRESFLASNQRYEQLAAAHPESAFLAWRIARNHWRQGERLPVAAKDDRRAAFTRSLEWAERSLARDPDCGECVLWAVVARGRLATTVGVVESVPMVAPMAGLIDRGIALQPTSRDNEWNTTLGNLYYAASAFYRVAPDVAWVEWVIGDARRQGPRARLHRARDRDLADARRLSPRARRRADLHRRRARRRRRARARPERARERARTMPHHLGTDAVDQKNAEILLAKPELACGYSARRLHRLPTREARQRSVSCGSHLRDEIRRARGTR